MSSAENYYITTPIYYVNARPHIGHTYTTIACDTLARYHRMKGDHVFFLTGTDEHGEKIVEAAEKEGKTPEQYTDDISAAFRETWQSLHISHDDYIRTTEERHKKVVQTVLQKIYDNGDIYLAEYEGRYCTGCERYLTDKELTEDGLCHDHLRPPEIIKEKNYFFKMQKYLNPWYEELQRNPHRVRPEGYYNELIGTIKELMNIGDDLSISRPRERLSWGIELPFDAGYVTYVWFDALLNYVSATGYPESDTYKKFWPEVRHMIAKDILKPHGIYWPTMLMAAGIDVYKQLLVHGYWLGFGDTKMSKSLGNALDPVSLAEKIGEDALRFFLMREMNFGADSRFSEEALEQRLNTNLANDMGNLVQRTLSMLKKYTGRIDPAVEDHEVISRLEDSFKGAITAYHENFAETRFSRAIEAVFEPVRLMNALVEEYRPWQMAKEDDASLPAFLQTLLKGILTALLLLKPVLPNKVRDLCEALEIDHKEFPEKVGELQLKPVELDKWPMFFARLDLTGEKQKK